MDTLIVREESRENTEPAWKTLLLRFWRKKCELEKRSTCECKIHSTSIIFDKKRLGCTRINISISPLTNSGQKASSKKIARKMIYADPFRHAGKRYTIRRKVYQPTSAQDSKGFWSSLFQTFHSTQLLLHERKSFGFIWLFLTSVFVRIELVDPRPKRFEASCIISIPFASKSLNLF